MELLSPPKVNQGWAVDFLSDTVVGPDKRKVRIINIMDEHSRKALWTEARQSVSAEALVGILDETAAYRGLPQYIRCDNGPEFISEALAKWAEENKVEIRFIQPGKPSQNGLVERLNGTLRKECLDLEWFTSMGELNDKIQQWSVVYNTLRPHSSLGYNTPDEHELLSDNFYFKTVAA